MSRLPTDETGISFSVIRTASAPFATVTRHFTVTLLSANGWIVPGSTLNSVTVNLLIKSNALSMRVGGLGIPCPSNVVRYKRRRPEPSDQGRMKATPLAVLGRRAWRRTRLLILEQKPVARRRWQIVVEWPQRMEWRRRDASAEPRATNRVLLLRPEQCNSGCPGTAR